MAIAAGVTPIQWAMANPHQAQQALYYPPEWTGLRGSHNGSFENTHRLARRGEAFNTQDLAVEEQYDLVIVGAGISGLAAAWFYRKQMGPDQRILLVDNHSDFGGSESLQSPHFLYSDVVKGLLDDLGVSIDGLASRFSVGYYSDLGLSKGVFFDQENFGINQIVSGDPGHGVADDVPIDRENGRSYREFIGDFPMPEKDREALIELHEETVDYLAGMSLEEKMDYIASHSYTQFLQDKVQLSPLAIKFFQQQTNDFQAVGIDATSCEDARLCNLPGFAAANLPPLDEESQAELDDLYIYHFPDGNASLARLLVQKLIPAVCDQHATRAAKCTQRKCKGATGLYQSDAQQLAFFYEAWCA